MPVQAIPLALLAYAAAGIVALFVQVKREALARATLVGHVKVRDVVGN